MRDIHISIVSHGHAAALSHLLGDLARMPSLDRCQLTLVCNIPEPHPETPAGLPVVWIDNATRRGFAANHNSAFRQPPLPEQRRYFVVLNPDVRIEGDVLAGLVELLQRRPQAGVAAPAVYSSDGTRQDSARELPGPARLLAKLFGRLGAWPEAAEPYMPDWVAGMCMVFRADAFAKLGGFDERYYLYYEDVDICGRAWLAGRAVWVDPAWRIVHDGQRASRRDWRHAAWHLASLLRFLTSGTTRRARRFHSLRTRGAA